MEFSCFNNIEHMGAKSEKYVVSNRENSNREINRLNKIVFNSSYREKVLIGKN